MNRSLLLSDGFFWTVRDFREQWKANMQVSNGVKGHLCACIPLKTNRALALRVSMRSNVPLILDRMPRQSVKAQQALDNPSSGRD